jgi:hypothetical protein
MKKLKPIFQPTAEQLINRKEVKEKINWNTLKELVYKDIELSCKRKEYLLWKGN